MVVQKHQGLAVAAGACVVTSIVLDAPWARWIGGLWTPAAVVVGLLAKDKSNETKTLVRNVLIARCLLEGTVRIRRMIRDWRRVKSECTNWVARWAKLFIPAVQREIEKARIDLRVSLRGDGSGEKRVDALTELPIDGKLELLEKMLETAAVENTKWEAGLVSGAVYNGEPEHIKRTNGIANAYAVANPLHPDIWPSVNQMEAEVVSMTARLLDGGNTEVCGCMTSGGTESIVLAVKAHRDKFKLERNIQHGEVIACVTAHAAVDKACDLLGLRLVKIPATSDYKLNLSAMRRAISSDTILIYASAPAFPQGGMDQVKEIAAFAHSFGLGCHVDCCLGGFILPFLPKEHMKTKPYDFSLPGVTSMSCDTHKYGYAPKGTSVLLFRDTQIRHYMYFCYPNWTGGLYVTPTIAGSRSGAVIAATWASLVSLGYKGLEQRALAIHNTANTIARRISKEIPELCLLAASFDSEGIPTVDAMIVCFTSANKKINVYALNDLLVKKGWSLNALQHPACLHLCCTVRTLPEAVQNKFIADLKEAVSSILSISNGDNKKDNGSAAIYGMASSMPAGPVSEILCCYTDIQLEVPLQK